MDDASAPDPVTRPPDYSILWGQRLVAYIWAAEAGALWRGSRGEPLVEIPFADILSLDASRQPALRTAAEDATDLDAFLFALKLEGFDVEEGNVTPHDLLRRF